MTSAVRSKRRGWRDDRGMAGIAATLMLLIVLAGAGLVYDGGRALAARRETINTAEAAARAGAATVTANGLNQDTALVATLEFLDAAQVARSDIVDIAVTANTVTVTLRASRSAVFAQLLGNDTIVVRGTGEATATFGNPP